MSKSFSQKDKTKFRKSSIWYKFKAYLKKRSKGNDEITGQPLHKGCNVHHLDINEENYRDLSNENHFVVVNKNTHNFIHWLYPIYKKNPQVLENLKFVMFEMKSLEEKDKFISKEE